MKIVDLDKLVSPPIKVKLGGRQYTVPGDLPADFYLEVNLRAQQQDVTDFESIRDLYDRLLGLFQVHQPDLTELPNVSVRQLLLAIGTIYGDGREEEEAEQPARPPRRNSSGGATRSPSQRKSSRR